MAQSSQNAFIQQCFGLGSQDTLADETQCESAPVPVLKNFLLRRRASRAPPQFNADGSETIEWARYQSAQRLREKWESIYARFKDAHLEDQDEIYLGVAGDAPRVIRDRGSLRALQHRLPFGSFIRDEDLDALAVHEEGDYTAYDPPVAPEVALQESGDPELQEFLRQEARRRALHGDDDDDDVVDLRSASLHPGMPHEHSVSGDVHDAPDAAPVPDIALELDIYHAVKRDAIEHLLRTQTLGTARLPYSDIPGMHEFLAWNCT
ncbi:hypothetical protein MVES1_002405 [Malassezia vespertilionis]|uniref:Uncharacterized protein n=1 Tax=Malassezia vespertilionis TaxID=2020962 RepID=A0A2N1JC08_9BASI|nr:uncharacterized protein MVES1_002405 [Malassezia vespertilionis]PKI84079.1 hypothetical protein MVES_002273 [Malassezia vespertilionis]WFD07049.1 hypothetical protein MVES1_002405 [Malassezia vespertilionis]